MKMRRMKAQSEFGDAVRRLRHTMAMSQEDLAEAAGLDRTYVSSLERGRRNPTLLTIMRVAAALHVSAAFLLAEMEAPTRPGSRAAQPPVGTDR